MSQSSHARADEFRKLWLQGNAPSIEEFVVACDPVSPAELAELLMVDQSQRWERGDAISPEQYFARFPELLNHRESAIDIVFSEFLLQERSGSNPPVDEYVDRFPEFADEFQRQIEFHRAVNNRTSDGDPVLAENVLTTDADQLGSVPQIPGYKILGELGRGGIGVVYKARHLQLNRPVALKMLLAGHFASPGLLRRFLLEAEATARVQHPNIVQIYEVGQHNGRPFLALEYINGGTLSQWTRGRPHPPRDAAALVQGLAAAVQFAHEQGVVHRDLKPGNVLIQLLVPSRNFAGAAAAAIPGWSKGSTTDSCSDSHVSQPNTTIGADAIDSDARSPTNRSLRRDLHFKIADFGLAKLIAGGESDADRVAATLSGDVLGTAAYMSPEQARGDAAKITGSTDIYSLGAILYELLTGRPPFVGLQPLEVLTQVISDEPVRPSNLVRRVPKDIQTICLKCLEKTPGRRYGSVGQLADDLGRFLADQPIVARHASNLERSWRWCRRHPIKTSVGASIAVVLILVALVSSVYSVLLGNQLTLTSTAKDGERRARIHALQQLWESKLSQADALRTSGQVGQRIDGLSVIDDAKELGNSIQFSPDQIDRMRNATIACLALPDLWFVEQWKEDWDKPYFPLTTDQQQSIYAYPSGDHEVVVRRTKDGVEAARIKGLDQGSIPILSPDGKKLAIVNDYCRVFVLGMETPRLVFEISARGAWSFLPVGQRIFGTDGNGVLSLVDLDVGKVIKTFESIPVPTEIAISPDSKQAAMLLNGTVQVIELDSGKIVFQADPPNLVGEKHFAWHPRSTILAVGPYLSDGIVLWDVRAGTKLTSLFHNAGEMNFCFNSAGDLLLTYDAWAGSMFLWDVSSGEVELSKFDVSLFAISANKKGGFGMLQLIEGANLARVVIEHSQIYQTISLIGNKEFIVSSNDLAYSADGQFLAIAINGNVQVFESERLVLLDELITGQCFIQFDGEGSLFTFNELGLNRWRSKKNSESNGPAKVTHVGNRDFGPPQFIGQARAHTHFDVSGDGNTIALPDADGALIWSADNPDPIRTIGSHPDVRDLSISTDGRKLVTGGWDGGKACVWDTHSGQLVHTIDEPNCCLIRYSPDGRWLVTNSNIVTIWETKSWLPIAKIHVPGQSVSGVSVCFSPDSNILAVSDSIARIHLFNPANGSEIATLTDPNKHLVSRMTFSPNGRHLAVLTNAAGGLVHVWDLVAIRNQLRQRNLDWLPVESTTSPNQADAGTGRVLALRAEPADTFRFVSDARFEQLEASEQVRRARLAAAKFDLASARAASQRAIELQPNDPPVCNDLAWLLSTGPLSLRDPEAALEFARRALENESLKETQRAFYLNTLGVALYRAGKYPEAFLILEQSLAMQPPENQPFDLYFLSMCSAQLNELKKARGYLEQAESLVEQYNLKMSYDWRTELALFAQESRSLLGD